MNRLDIPHAEGKTARKMEAQTSQLPSDVWLWAAGASILASLLFRAVGRSEDANFIGHWAPTFLIIGVYNKIVKLLGSE